MSFLADERDTMRVEEEMIVSGIKNVIKECGPELDAAPRRARGAQDALPGAGLPGDLRDPREAGTQAP